MSGKIAQFLETTTFHGLADLQRTKKISLKIVWAICCLAVFPLCGYSVVTAAIEYGKYSAITEIKHTSVETIPALTVCPVRDYNSLFTPVNGPDQDFRDLQDSGIKNCTSGQQNYYYKDLGRVFQFLYNQKLCNYERGTEKLDWDTNQGCFDAMYETLTAETFSSHTLYVSRDQELGYFQGMDYMLENYAFQTDGLTLKNRSLSLDNHTSATDVCSTATPTWSGEPRNKGVYDVFLNTMNSRIDYRMYLDGGLMLARTLQFLQKNYSSTAYVTISKRKRFRHCSRKTQTQLHVQAYQCVADLAEANANCCACGFGVQCRRNLPCCTSLQACKVNNEQRVQDQIESCHTSLWPPCEETKYDTIVTSKWEEGSPGWINIVPQNMFDVLLFEERLRYEFCWLLSTTGGFLGLLVGGSVLSILQACLFCLEAVVERAKRRKGISDVGKNLA